MKAVSFSIPGIILLEPKVFHDNRGYFYESLYQRFFEENTEFSPKLVQDNYSKSSRDVLRGMQYQPPPNAQGKLVRVIHGEIFDVVVDIREASPTFGQWNGEKQSADNKNQLWIPPGFAHGFLTLSETAEVHYKTTEFYNSDCEKCIVWNDPTIKIDWPLHNPPTLSKKDLLGLALNEANLK